MSTMPQSYAYSGRLSCASVLCRTWRRLARTATILLMAGLAACAQTGRMVEPGLTPQQQALRSGVGQHAKLDYEPKVRTGATMAEGAVVVGILGALLGAAVSGNRAQGALIGGALGAAGGAAGGAALANNAQNKANREAALKEAIGRADKDARSFQAYASAARAVAASAQVAIADLDRRYRARQITTEQFRSQAAIYRRDLQAMQSLAADAERARAAMSVAGNPDERTGFQSASYNVQSATADLNRAAATIGQALAQVPTG